MNELIQKNIVVVLGDLGAGINFVKNILLLSPDVDFPWSNTNSRFDFITKSVYPTTLKTNPNTWVTFEHNLRSWRRFYNVDIADLYQDINTERVRQRCQNNKIVFICHLPEVAAKLKAQYPDINIVSLYAETNQEVAWQVSQYISKLGITNILNFTFEENIEQQKQQYIDQFGQEQYLKLNALNMLEVFERRKSNFYSEDYITIKIADIQTANWIPAIAEQLDLKIDLTQASALLDIWKNLNPPHIEYWK